MTRSRCVVEVQVIMKEASTPLAISHKTARPAARTRPKGLVIRVTGPFVDARLPDRSLPAINSILDVHWNPGRRLTLEVSHRLDTLAVRCVGIPETAGLRCGAAVSDNGAQFLAPTGPAVLRRLINVLGGPIDHGPALGAEDPRAGIHKSPPALMDQQRGDKVFLTGIKVIDLLATWPQ